MLKVQIRDRSGQVPLRLKSYTRRKLRRLVRHFDLLTDAEVEFTEESRRSQEPIHVVDLTVRGIATDLEVLRARESGRELLPVIDLALNKLDGEVTRLKEKVRPYP
ncbi:MAG TPA: ribosome-associated translation inhibitor RaiA [Candidatus Dormibacteraeota bacterium]|nr:ribosome-associated translation inhibitor RaiA [Candidatus Dormibacteraeota bacterium]